MWRNWIFVWIVSTFSLPGLVHAQRYEIPRLPGAELLVEGYLPDRVLITTEETTTELPAKLVGGLLSMSPDGKIIAVRRRIPVGPPYEETSIISTYSLWDQKWTDYAEFNSFSSSAAISADGSKIAYVSQDSLGDRSGEHFTLRVLNLKTREAKVVTRLPGSVLGISWSPDGRRLAFDMHSPDYPGHRDPSEIQTVWIADTESGKISRTAIGLSPSWSPSGEWIAYVSYIPTDRVNSDRSDYFEGQYYDINNFQVRLMAPDGRHSRVLMGFHPEVVPNLRPVWSPDSKAILFNKSTDPDSGAFDIVLLDINSGKAKRRFKNVAPIYAWVQEGH